MYKKKLKSLLQPSNFVLTTKKCIFAHNNLIIIRMRKFTFLLAVIFAAANLFAEQYKSKTWISDLGNGRYRNPILYADYPELDVCKAGDDYYMVSASRHTSPGIPVLKSSDMVNWQYVNYVLPSDNELLNISYNAKGISHPCIRTQGKTIYVFFSDPSKGIFMSKTNDITKGWEAPVTVMEGKNLSSPCPIWDAAGKLYLLHGYEQHAYGRYNNLIAICELDNEYKAIKSTETIIFDANELGDIKSSKIVTKGKFYYIFCAAYKKFDSRILCLRSENITGPYESNTVMYQAKTNMEGPYNGAYIETAGGEGWYIHNQHIENFGHPVMLDPVKWEDNWPTIGGYNKGGSGEPITNYKKPGIAQTPIVNPEEDDQFEGEKIGLQWQWNSQFTPMWAFLNRSNGKLRLYSNKGNANLAKQQNLLLQKLPNETFTVTAKVALNATDDNTRCGIMIAGKNYGEICLKKVGTAYHVSQGEGAPDKNEVENQRNIINQQELYLRVKVKSGVATFSYSLDGEIYYILGKEFTIMEADYIGTRIGLFCTHQENARNIGWCDIEFVEFSK